MIQRTFRFRTRRGLLIVGAIAIVAVAASVSQASLRKQSADDDAAGAGKQEAIALLDAEMREQRALAKAKRPKKPDPLAARRESQPDPRPSAPGLVDVSPPFPSSVYLLGETGWQEVVGESQKVVYAGALTLDARQGIVIVVRSKRVPDSPAPDFARQDQGLDIRFRVFKTPGRVGAVEIVAADGQLLTVAVSSGQRFRFDVRTERFVSG